MNKVLAVLSVVLAGSVLTALMYARDAQRERARADALVERVFELEPVERSNRPSSAPTQTRVQPVQSRPAAHAVEPTVEQLAIINTPQAPRAVMEFQGTLRARKQVERLQLALATGTPLQEYQIQALITALDDVDREMERRGAAGTQFRATTNERMVRAAADILFESQLEVFIALLQDSP